MVYCFDMPSTTSASTGHSRALRRKLATQRTKLGLTQQQVADRIAAEMGKESISGSAVGQWEAFSKHPTIDHYASWCRVLGLRLILEIEDGSSNRVPVLLSPDVAELARAIDMADTEERQIVRQVVQRMLRER